MLQGFNITFYVVKYFKFISALKWTKCKNTRISNAVNHCQTNVLCSDDTLEIYCHIHTCALVRRMKGVCLLTDGCGHFVYKIV